MKDVERVPRELQLLFACSRVSTIGEDDAAIRRVVAGGIDWAAFVRKAMDHGLAGLAGHTLLRVAPDLVPDEILDAFRVLIEHTRRGNLILFRELADVIAALAEKAVAAIPCRGPVLAFRAFGDLGLRMFRDLDLLVRDGDLASATEVLRGLGYESRGEHILFKSETLVAIQLHARFAPDWMAVELDDAGLWQRACRGTMDGRSLLMLAPEDELILLALRGGSEQWRSLKGACDVAALLASHPQLDWQAVLARAQAQGCRRMVLLAASLARRCFGAALPDAVSAAECSDRVFARTAERVVAHWAGELPANPPDLRDGLQLRDGMSRQARSLAWAIGAQRWITTVPLRSRQILAQTARLARSTVALAIQPASAETKRYQQARAEAKDALAVNPNDWGAWRTLGDALAGLKRYTEAIACFERALVFVPDNANIWRKWKSAMTASGNKAQLPEIAREPQVADAWAVRAGAFWFAERLGSAIDAAEIALKLDPGHVAAARLGIVCRLHSADWRRRDEDQQRINEGLVTGALLIRPIEHRYMCDSEKALRVGAGLWARSLSLPENAPRRPERYRHDKIRIAYLSTDLRNHPVGSVIVGCLEHHDRQRFEISAVSLHGGDGSALRRRIEAAFDRFIPAHAMSNEMVSRAMRELEIDVAIDLNGYTVNSRPEILGYQPAPVQVNYLGYPGTMDVPFIDYLIADHSVVPKEHQIHYREKIAYLPQAYLPYDRKRRITEPPPSRTEAGLPETGFVFACFNHAFKVGPELFDVWMRLLRGVDDSVLWLRATNVAATLNLRREAEIRGINAERLVFAPRVVRTEDYLARLQLADLFLDTLPYNAHATASDALWAGLPVLTRVGNAFPGRVAASLLYAVGLPELVTASLEEYEGLALALARDPKRLSALRAKLIRNRDTAPLFDTARFTRHIETAYAMMWERNQRGEGPESFSVPDDTALQSVRGEFEFR